MTTVELIGVRERDVDLLLLEEFIASPPFFEWFLDKIGLGTSAHLTGCARSVLTSTGESDLELTVRIGRDTVKILVENKVDAQFQLRQPERYRVRVEDYVRDGTCARAVTVVIAPAADFPNDIELFGFDYRMSYETLLGWFENDASLGPRSLYKRALLGAAISRGGAGWQLVPDAATTDFWMRYWELARATAPELRMPRPSEKPRKSSFIRFKPAGLPTDVKLVHKVRHGNVDLEFKRMGDRTTELEGRYHDHMTPRNASRTGGKVRCHQILRSLN